MEKFKYQKIEDYEYKKNCILNAIKEENGGVLPFGYDNDIFVSALIKEVKVQLVKSSAKMWVLLLHDPVHGNTVEYDITDKVTVIDHGALVSRGSNIMPRIEKLFT